MIKTERQDSQGDSVKRFLVTAETVYDPHHNYTVLGAMPELDVTEFDSIQAAAATAVDRAVEAMPERNSDIVDSNFRVFIVDGWVHVPVPEDWD